MERRQFLQLAAAYPIALLAPNWLEAETQAQRVAVLIELHGGNDGMNTLIPYREDAYYAARPTLAIPRNEVLAITEQYGMHPALEPLLETWEEGRLGWVHGVGYPDQNRSHFRSIEIWETASNSNEHENTGWIAAASASHDGGLKGIAIGEDLGPLAGAGTQAVVFHDVGTFLRQGRELTPLATRNDNPALAHIINVHNRVVRTADEIRTKLRSKPLVKARFPETPIGQDLKLAAQLILSGVGASAYKVTLGSFDTHTYQLGRHDRLLRQLSDALAAFQATMKETDRWQDVLVMTYSEFGRRVHENGSGGTDHGAAAAQMFAGGAVRGGLFGEPPSLTNLDRGDLRYTTDFRQLYSTIIKNWWGLPSGPLEKYQPIDVIG